MAAIPCVSGARYRYAAVAAVFGLIAYADAPAHAESIVCQSVNGVTRCLEGNGSISCVTINGKSSCRVERFVPNPAKPDDDVTVLIEDGRVVVRTGRTERDGDD